jgi:hypothetical protein
MNTAFYFGHLFLKQHVVHSFRLSDLTGKCEKMAFDNIKEYCYSYAETVI